MRIQSIKTARNLHTVSILELKIFFGRIQIKKMAADQIADAMDRDDYKITRWQRLQDHKKEYEDNKLYCFLLKDCPELPTIIFYYGL